ncbi:hypothetical protein [Halorhabdus amylolytica]|uniref:hypothetical protein n=1 Tax=Halorhabdus amylolytica TaxID=2559573 RepID=UPI0010AABE6F|nr:hypothetical protein [Halorhabdus amylolytica]
MGNQNALRAVLLAVIMVGGLSGLSTHLTAAEFSDSHAANSQISAASNFNNGGTGLTADAGGPYTVTAGSTLILEGWESSVDRGNIRTYSWEVTSGPGWGWRYPSLPWGVYLPPDNVNGTTQAVIELTVTDNKGNTDTDTATISIQEANTGYVVRANSRSAEIPKVNKNKEDRVYFGNYTER